MGRSKDTNIRVDPEVARVMRELASFRLKTGLAKFDKKELSTREMSRLWTKTDGWKISIEELKTKPKKEYII